MSSSSLADFVKAAFYQWDRRLRRPRTLYVTEAVTCSARAFFNLLFNAEPPAGPKMIIGKALHSVLPKVLKWEHVKWEVECTHPLDFGYALAGRADAVGDYAVYEFKFTGKKNRADAAYYAQLNCYLNMLDREKGYLVLIDRGSFDVEVLELERDRQAFALTLREVNSVVHEVEKAKKGEEVKIPHGPKWDWECKSCVYRVVCPHARGVGE